MFKNQISKMFLCKIFKLIRITKDIINELIKMKIIIKLKFKMKYTRYYT